MIRRGYVHWAQLDKRRPALVLSVNSRNEAASDVILVPCSTRKRPSSWHVPLARGEGGLPSPSVARCESVQTLSKQMIEDVPLGGQIPAHRMGEIERAVMLAMGIDPESHRDS